MDSPFKDRIEIDRGSLQKDDLNSRYISDDLRKSILERDGHKCVNCDDTDYLEIDHAIPFSMGGLSEPDNLQVLCRRCNSKKRDRQWWGPTLRHVGEAKLGVEGVKLLYRRTRMKFW